MNPHNGSRNTARLLLATIASVGLAGPAIAQSYRVIYSFTDGADGARPIGG